MKTIFKNLIIAIVLLSSFSCQALLKWQTKRNSIHSSLDKKIAFVSQSMTNLTKINDLDVGIHISQEYFADQLANVVNSLNQTNWSNDFVDSINLGFNKSELILVDESIQFTFSSQFFINQQIANINSLTADFTATVSISSSGNTLLLYPNFDAFRIRKFDGKKLRKDYRRKLELIEALLVVFNRELNQLLKIKPISIPLDFGIFNETAVSSLLSSSPDQRIISSDTLRVGINLASIAFHTAKEGIFVMADLELTDSRPQNENIEPFFDKPLPVNNEELLMVSNTDELGQLEEYALQNWKSKELSNNINARLTDDLPSFRKPLLYTGDVISLDEQDEQKERLSQIERDTISSELGDILIALVSDYIDSVNARKKQLEEVLTAYKLNYEDTWNANFDPIDNSGVWIETQKSFISELFNYSVNQVDFRVQASSQVQTRFVENNIRVGKASIVDNCSTVRDRHCSRPSCNLWSCCSCKWYRPHCCACGALRLPPYLACKAAGEAQYGACKALNYSKYLWCKTKIVGKKLFNELAKVGDIEADITASGTINLDYNSLHLRPDLSGLVLDSWISGRGSANLKFNFNPEGLVGYLACGPLDLRINETINVNAITQEFDMSGQIELINEENLARIKVTTESENIFLIISPPPTVALLTNPRFVIQCPIVAFGVGLGTFVLSLAGKDDLQKNAIAALTGLYDYRLKPLTFDFPIEPIEFQPSDYFSGLTLTPRWANKGLVFTAN